MNEVVVVGAGVAGLATALAIRDRAPSASVTVLEGAPRPGGSLQTDRIDGFLVERGPNGFLDNAPDTLALAARLGLGDRVLRASDAARHRFIYRGGRLHAVPMSPVRLLASGLLSVPGRLRIAAEPWIRRRPAEASDESIHAFAARRIGREAADVMVGAMVTGIFGGDARALSLGACFPLMEQMEREHGSLVRAMIARRRQRGASGAPMGSPAGHLTSFAGGVQDLIDALVAAVDRDCAGSSSQPPRVPSTPNRGCVRTGAAVQAVSPAGDGWRVELADGSVEHAAAVVLATPATVSARLVGAADPALADALHGIPSAPVAVVALAFDGGAIGHPLDGFGFLVPPGEPLPVLGALWDSSIFPNRAPADAALVRVLLGGARDPATVDLDEAALVARARDALARAMGLDARPRWTRVVRHRLGIPQYTMGHRDRLATIEQRAAALPGLVLTGNSYRGISMNACITDAKRAADAVASVLSGRIGSPPRTVPRTAPEAPEPV